MMAVKVVLKLIITAVLLLVATQAVDLSLLHIDLREFSISVWCASAALLLCQFIFVRALRWNHILGAIDHRLPITAVMLFASVGQFFNQVLPSSIGGDGMLVYLARSERYPLRVAIHSVAIDRIIGTTALFALSALTLLFALPYVADKMLIAALVSLSMIGFYVGFNFPAILPIVARFLPARFSDTVSEFLTSMLAIWQDRMYLLVLLALCCLGHICMATAVCLVALAFGVPAPLIPLIFLLPGVFLLTIIPVSFGGWGMRETGMIILLSGSGMRPSDALAISALYGLTEFTVSTLGGIVWLFLRKRTDAPQTSTLQRGSTQ